MKLINKNRLTELAKRNSNIIFGKKNNIGEYFLDEIRVGLTVSSIIELPDEIDFKKTSDIGTNELNRINCIIRKGKFYLAITEEHFSIPDNIIGIINTRSKFARIGMEAVSSSWFVVPNFGSQNPTPLILEVKSFVTINNVDFSSPVSYMLLFEISERIKISRIKDYHNRFPFSLW